MRKRRLGRTGLQVSIFGLGGEGVLRSTGKDKEAGEVVKAALDAGVNYIESARAYSESELYIGEALEGRRDEVVLATKTHARDRAGVEAHLEESLTNLRTDHLDIWYLHDMRTHEEVDRVLAPGGALEGMTEARDKGKARFLGVTGHHDPEVLARCLEEFDFDVVLIPVNPAEPSYKCFLEEIAPLAGKKDIGVAGMKVYMKGLLEAPKKLLFCYALTQPISTGVIGCDTAEQVRDNAEIAESFLTLTGKEVARLTDFIKPHARELMYYKP